MKNPVPKLIRSSVSPVLVMVNSAPANGFPSNVPEPRPVWTNVIGAACASAAKTRPRNSVTRRAIFMNVL